MTRLEMMQRFPELVAQFQFWDAISKEKNKEYVDSKKVDVLDPRASLYHNVPISVAAITDMVQDIPKFMAILDYFRTDTNFPFTIFFETEDEKIDSYSFSKYEIIKGLEKSITKGELKTDQQAIGAYQMLAPLVSVDALIDKYRDKEYTLKIEGVDHTFSSSGIVSLLLSNSYEFMKTISQKEIDGVPTEHYMYALTEFIRHEGITQTYNLSDDVIKRCQKLNQYEELDFEAVNKMFTTENVFLDDIQVNPELSEHVLSGMPKDYTDLEKAIYIYLKMCHTLTYDPMFFAVDQRGQFSLMHKDIKNIPTITPDNNKITCYEFASIYTSLLASQNINHKLVSTAVQKDEYGRGHFKAEFRDGKFLVSADAVTGILNSDMTSAKTDWNIHGLTCMNRNHGTKQEFYSVLNKVINHVSSQTKEGPVVSDISEETYEESLNAYMDLDKVSLNIPFTDRVGIMLEQIGKSGLEGIDAHSYLLQLRKTLFTKDEQDKQIDITVIRHNTREEDNPVDAISVITIAEDYTEKESPMSYILYSAGEEPRPMEKEDVEGLMRDDVISYVTYPMKRIPGIFPNESDEGLARAFGLDEDFWE